MIIKNQHLLAGLVVLGVLQLWALGCLERASSGVERRLKEEITTSRNERQRDTEVLLKETGDLKRQVDQTQAELRNTQDLLTRTRVELDKLKAAATRESTSGEERKP
jgi:hypothetical protein